jgi:regulator of replication initiation timing
LDSVHQSLRDHKANSTTQAKDFEASTESLREEMMHARTAFQNDMAVLRRDVSGLRRDMSSLQSETIQVQIKLDDVSSAVTMLKAQAEEEAKKKAREEAKKKDARDWYWIYAVR